MSRSGPTGSKHTVIGTKRKWASLPGHGQQMEVPLVKAAVGTEAASREEQVHHQAEAMPRTRQRTSVVLRRKNR